MGIRRDLDHLMGDGGPEGQQPTRLNRKLVTAKQVSHGAAFHQIQLHMVVIMRLAHDIGQAAFADQAFVQFEFADIGHEVSPGCDLSH